MIALVLALFVATTVAVEARAEAEPSAATALEEAFGRAADRALPSVVGITSYTRGREDLPSGTPSWRVAGEIRNPRHTLLASRTGIIVSEDGFILTSHHGLIDASSGKAAALIEVELPDRSFERARFIGSEPSLDLAVLKVDSSQPLVPATMSRETPLRTGQRVIALGDPPGPQRTFAAEPIASPPLRECYQEELTATLIQASMHIPKESWGGPWVNLSGEVVGISVAREQDRLTGAPATGAAFALPIELAMNLYGPLIVRESAHSPWLGISVLEAPRSWRNAQREARRTAQGVLIDDVFENSPAARAGIRVGDVLTGLGDAPVTSVASFQRQLYLNGAGTRVRLEFWRDGESLTAEAEIEVRPSRIPTR